MAKVKVPVAHYFYIPPRVLAQFPNDLRNGDGRYWIDQQDSQWTLGVIFCELFTGFHPFEFFEELIVYF